MITQLIILLREEEKFISELLMLLKIQNEMIKKRDVYGLEDIISKLKENSKEIARKEITRKELIKNESLKVIVSNSDNRELKEVYEKIHITINKTIVQKESNDMLLKQGIIFTSKMLNLMKPDNGIKKYNSCGKYT